MSSGGKVGLDDFIVENLPEALAAFESLPRYQTG